MRISHAFDAILFHVSAVMCETDGQLESVYDVRRALQALEHQNKPVLLVTNQSEKDTRDYLEALKLRQFFESNGASQIIKQDVDEDQRFYRPLLDMDITPSQCLAVAAQWEEVKPTLTTGISNIIGFYGSQAVPFGQALDLKDSFRRVYEGRTSAQNLTTIGLYSELPVKLMSMRPTRQFI